MTVEIGTTFKEPGYTVKEDEKDVTSKAVLKKTVITDTTTNTVVQKIDTTKAGNYTITYTIDYEKTSKTLKRTVVVSPVSVSDPDKDNSSTDKNNNSTNNNITQ